MRDKHVGGQGPTKVRTISLQIAKAFEKEVEDLRKQLGLAPVTWQRD